MLSVCAAASATAEADVSKAWTAAKDNLPAATKAIGAVDVAVAVKTKSFKVVWDLLLREERDLRQVYEGIQQGCKLDLVQTIQGFVVAGDPDADRGVVFVQLAVDRKAATTCIETIGKQVGGVKVAQDGMFTTVSMGKDTLYLAWPSANVVAIALEPEQKAEYTRWLGGKGALAKSKLGARLAKVDTTALAWGAIALDKPFDDNDLPFLAAHGTLVAAKGSATLAIRATYADAATATKSIAETRSEIDKDIAKKSTPAAARKLFQAIKVAAVGADGTLDATATDADLSAAVESLTK